MPRLLALALLCLLLSACAASPAKEDLLYLAERANARQLPASLLMGMRLRLGMDSAQVVQHLDSLRRRDELGWHLPFGWLPTTVEPHYDSRGRLVQVRLLLEADAMPGGLAHLALQRDLREAFGGEGLPHGRGPGGPGSRSWFQGGTEVELTPHPALGYFEMTYTDLPHTEALTPEQLNSLTELEKLGVAGDTVLLE